jgi:hypothetical protein
MLPDVTGTPPPLAGAASTRGVRPAPIVVLIIAAILGILIWSIEAGPLGKAYDGVQQPPLMTDSGPALKDVPAVEPMELKQVAPSLAKEINDATPFTREPVPPARPFYMTGAPIDRDRATDCLAAAIWYEAGAETLSGKKAVAQVVLNRVRHPAFPKTVCGVVFQGAERRTGCQFTFTCDGAMARTPSAYSWSNARGLARIMLMGEVFKPVGTATHYHTDWVLPAWSAKLDKVHKESTHLFFRWMGWWGDLAAFKGRYLGSEPVVTQLVSLSPSHAMSRNGDILLPGSLDVMLDTQDDYSGKDRQDIGLPSNPYGFKPTLQSPTADFLVFVVPRKTDPAIMLSLVLFSCSVKPYCKIMIWTDAKPAPTRLPVADEFLPSMAFSYLRNRSSGLDKALWNCDLFPRGDASQCMKSRPAKTASPPQGAGSPQDAIPQLN